jgi:L-galactose dehydrogenase
MVNASPLSSGLLSTRGVGDWHPATNDDLNIFRKAAEFCKENNTSIERLAIQFSTAHKEIPITLVASSNRERMLEIIQC